MVLGRASSEFERLLFTRSCRTSRHTNRQADKEVFPKLVLLAWHQSRAPLQDEGPRHGIAREHRDRLFHGAAYRRYSALYVSHLSPIVLQDDLRLCARR